MHWRENSSNTKEEIKRTTKHLNNANKISVLKLYIQILFRFDYSSFSIYWNSCFFVLLQFISFEPRKGTHVHESTSTAPWKRITRSAASKSFPRGAAPGPGNKLDGREANYDECRVCSAELYITVFFQCWRE